MTKVDQLPSELVSLILSYIRKWDLPSCALVNKSFYREAMPLLWHNISIRSTESFLAISTRLMQSPHVRHVRSLYINIKFYASVLEQDVPTLASLGNNINIQHIPRYCPRLTSLEIRCDRNPDPVVFPIARATIASVGQYCKQLTKLVLRECVYSNYDDLFGALKDAPLTEIQLTLPRKLDTAQRFLETAPLALHRYPLTKLTIFLYDDATRFIHTINTHGLAWPHLTTFDLHPCHSLTDPMALLFVQAHPTLRFLSLDFSQLTDAFLDGLYLPSLTKLDLFCTPAITAPGICRLIKNYDGRLDEVYCNGCGIYPKDVPDDKTYDYEMECSDDENPEVARFSGTFYEQ